MPTAERRTTYREVLAHREFSAVLVAWLASMLGNVMAHVALSYLVFSRSGSPLLAALAFSIGWLPHLFIATVLSGLPDRVPPRRLMVGADLACAGVVALMVLPGMPVAGLLGLVLLQGCITPVFAAARTATLPDLLPGDHYVVGRGLLSMVAQGSQLVGYLLGAVLLTVVSPSTALLVDAASFVCSAVVLRVWTGEHRSVAPSAPLAKHSLDGLRQIFRDRRLRALLLLGWLPPMLGVIPESVAIPYAAAHGGGASGAAVLLSAVAAGVIVSEVVVARFLRPSSRRRVMGPLALSISLPPLVFVFSPTLPVAALLVGLSGVGWSYGLTRSQLWLDALPDELRTRGLTLDGSGMMLTQALGFALGGAAAEWLAPHLVIVLGGAVGLVVTGLVLGSLRRIGALDPSAAVRTPNPRHVHT